MRRMVTCAMWLVMSGSGPALAQAVPERLAAPSNAAVCAPDLTMPAVAERAVAANAPSTAALRRWAEHGDAAARRCGLRALAALRTHDASPLFAAALERDDGRDDAWMIARWATWIAGGPDTEVSAGFAPLVDVLANGAVAAAAGDDGVRLLGEIASPLAIATLRAIVATDRPYHRVDAAIHALARQGDASVRARISALGHAEADGLATNATYEQARRIGAAAFYLLALGVDTRDDGLRLLSRLSPADQADAGAWAVQTLCERAIRRPAEAAAATAAYTVLVDALDQRGIDWAPLTRGTFMCPTR